jgi:hypothetical protein
MVVVTCGAGGGVVLLFHLEASASRRVMLLDGLGASARRLHIVTGEPA